jgi:hypothetical protein
MISDLTTEINDLGENGAKDLALSEDAHKAYVSAITTFRDKLQAQLDAINALEGLGDPGELESAIATKANLQRQGNAFKYSIAEYMKYLDAFSAAVDKAAKRLIDAG